MNSRLRSAFYLITILTSAFYAQLGKSCQIVCSDSKEKIDLILCDPEGGFQTILWFRDANRRPESATVSEQLKCDIDNDDGRITLCSKEGGHSFKSRILGSVSEIDPVTKKTVHAKDGVLEVEIESPDIKDIPEELKQNDKNKLKLTFPLKSCSAKSTAERQKGRP